MRILVEMQNSSLEDVYHNIVDQLQGDPYTYDDDKEEEESASETAVEQPVLPA